RSALPPDPEQEREHRPGRRQARGPAGSGVLHARGNDGHERRRGGRGRQVPARARDEPVLPDAARPPGQSLPGAARRAPARGLCDEHGPGRRARGRRALTEGPHQALLGDRQGHRGGHDRVGAGPRLRLLRRGLGAGDRRAGDPAAAPPLREPGPRRRVPGSGRALQGRACRLPARLPEPERKDRRRGRLAPRVWLDLPPDRRRLAAWRERASMDTTRAALDRFLASPALAEATRRAYGVDVREFARWLERRGTRLDDVDVRVLADYAAELGRARPRKLAPATIGRKLAAVRAFLRHSLGPDRVPDASFAPRRPRRLPDAPRPQEVDGELDALDGPSPLAIRNRALV